MTRENKLKVLVQATGGGITAQMQKFFQLVLEAKREKYLTGINQAYIDLYRKQYGINVQPNNDDLNFYLRNKQLPVEEKEETES